MKVLTTAEQERVDQLYRFLNELGQTGWLDTTPVVIELGQILGVHPSTLEPAIRKQLREFGI